MSTDKTAQAKAELEAFFARQEEETAPAWMPGEGESIFGEVIALRMGLSQPFGDQEAKPYPIVVLRCEFGPRTLHGFHTMLREGWKEVGLHIGQRLGITYKGTKLKNVAKDKPEAKLVPTDYYEMYFVKDLDNLTAEPAGEAFTLD